MQRSSWLITSKSCRGRSSIWLVILPLKNQGEVSRGGWFSTSLERELAFLSCSVQAHSSYGCTAGGNNIYIRGRRREKLCSKTHWMASKWFLQMERKYQRSQTLTYGSKYLLISEVVFRHQSIPSFSFFFYFPPCSSSGKRLSDILSAWNCDKNFPYRILLSDMEFANSYLSF